MKKYGYCFIACIDFNKAMFKNLISQVCCIELFSNYSGFKAFP